MGIFWIAAAVLLDARVGFWMYGVDTVANDDPVDGEECRWASIISTNAVRRAW